MPFKSDDDVRNYVRRRRRQSKGCSVSHLRRSLSVGYKKAKRIVDEVEEELRKEVQDHPERASLLTPPPRKKKRGTKRPRKVENEEELKKEDGIETRAGQKKRARIEIDSVKNEVK